MNRYFKFTFVLILTLGIISCSSSNEPELDPVERPVIDLQLSSEEKSIAANQYEFPIDLLSAAYVTENEPNIMVSPLSASMVLGMLANAIDPEERHEILQTLKLQKNQLSTFNSYMYKLLCSLPCLDSQSNLTLDNSFWHKDDVSMSVEYQNLLIDQYFAQLGIFKDFNLSAINEINGWICEKTNGGIERLLLDIETNSHVNTVWVNALYFKGYWSQSFDESITSKKPFFPAYPDTSQPVIIDMMCGGNFRYKHYHFPDNAPKYDYGFDYDDAITAVMLPYGNESFIFTAVLPAVNNPDIISTLNELTPEFWQTIDGICAIEMKEPGDVPVYLPKLSLEKTTNLIPILSNMGLNNIFDEVSMEENLGLPQQEINIFRQKAVFDLDEKGAELKVATGASGMFGAAGPPEFIEFNRPFLYFVRERTTGAVLLEGIVMNP